MNKNRILILVLLIFNLGINVLADDFAEKIVKKADAVRGPGQPFAFPLKITNYIRNEVKGELLLRINVYDNTHTLCEYIKPVKEKGKKLLFIGNNLWFHSPKSKRSIRITPQQRLLGQASSGDIASTNYGGDYTAKLLGEEKIKPFKSKKKINCYKLELIRKNKRATYHRILYWVTKNEYQPIVSEFYARSGKLIKKGYFAKYKTLMGRKRPALMVIVNSINKNKVTVLEYGTYRKSNYPKSKYQRSQLSN